MPLTLVLDARNGAQHFLLQPCPFFPCRARYAGARLVSSHACNPILRAAAARALSLSLSGFLLRPFVVIGVSCRRCASDRLPRLTDAGFSEEVPAAHARVCVLCLRVSCYRVRAFVFALASVFFLSRVQAFLRGRMFTCFCVCACVCLYFCLCACSGVYVLLCSRVCLCVRFSLCFWRWRVFVFTWFLRLRVFVFARVFCVYLLCDNTCFCQLRSVFAR